MVLGFGCNVPAIYATRTIEKRDARLLTGLLIPFMSCSARLPVYLIFGMVFFPQNANLVIFLLYLVGIFVAAVIALLASRLIFKGRTLSIMIMELPAYRKPHLKTTLNYAWTQSGHFLRKAGTLIVTFSMLLWVLLNFPAGASDPAESYFGRVSQTISPVLEPAGFGDWEASGALVTGLVAKEMVVSTLAQVYHVPQPEAALQTGPFLQDLKELGIGLGEAAVDAGKELADALTPGIALFPIETTDTAENSALSVAIMQAFTPLSAAAYLIFVLLYVPCVATLSAQRQEFGWKWAAVSLAITLIVPWLLSVSVYQIGSLLGLGG
jgi:ferrous iron transport protein B